MAQMPGGPIHSQASQHASQYAPPKAEEGFATSPQPRHPSVPNPLSEKGIGDGPSRAQQAWENGARALVGPNHSSLIRFHLAHVNAKAHTLYSSTLWCLAWRV